MIKVGLFRFRGQEGSRFGAAGCLAAQRAQKQTKGHGRENGCVLHMPAGKDAAGTVDWG